MVSHVVLACLLAVLTIFLRPASGESNDTGSPSTVTSWSCAKWHKHMEEALVAEDDITHRLQDIFFPVSGRAPFILMMEYEILYLSNGTLEQKNLFQGWSSSAVLSVVHPFFFLHWQPWLEGVFLLQGMVNYTTVNIPLLIVDDIGESPPDLALKCAVEKLTSWLRVYAEYQGRPQRWDVHGKGFIWEQDRVTAADGFVVIAILAMQILLQLCLKRYIFETVSLCLEKETMWRLCVWSAGNALLVIGTLLLAPDVITLYLIGVIGGVPFTLLSVVSLLIVFLSSVGWGIAGAEHAHLFPPDPMSFLLPHKWRYYLLFLSYVLFTNIALRSAIPTLLLTMVFPLESVSAIGLGCFVFLVLVMFDLLCKSQTLKDCYSFFLMLILSIVITCVVAVYVSILFTGSGINEYFQTFLPSLGAVVVGYWIKKFLDKIKRNKEKELPT